MWYNLLYLKERNMPYIDKERRKHLDESIDKLCFCIFSLNKDSNSIDKISNEGFLSIAGDINYCFSRIILKLIGKASYSKIAIATGVLENIKQEFYRRLASNYEDIKMKENGDVSEYV